MSNPVSPKLYWDSICRDLDGAETAILHDTVYYSLNLCRALVFAREGAVLSKLEGGKRALEFLLPQFRSLVEECMEAYIGSVPLRPRLNEREYRLFAEYMLNEINRITASPFH